MMSKLPYAVFLVVFFIPFLTSVLSILPRSLNLIFELISGLILLAAFSYGAFHKTFNINIKYLILFIFLCGHFLAGALVNSVDAGTFFSGLRNYLKYMPLFFLPLVYQFTDQEIKEQMKFLIALALLQFPIVIVQKYILGWGPDPLAGTLVIGSIMSIYLVSCVVILSGLYFRERISGKTFLMLSLLCFVPTTLNETKGSIILMIVALLVVMIGTGLKKSHLIISTISMMVMSAIFIFVYNRTYDVAGEEGLLNFFTDVDRGVGFYLYSGDALNINPDDALESTSPIIGALPSLDIEEDRIRRLDAVVLPFRVLSDDPVKLFMGLGIGNASDSSIHMLSGRYPYLAKLSKAMPALPLLIWEIGIVGLCIYLLFFFFIFMDSRYLAKTDGLSGPIALGWSGVVVLIVLSLPYKNFMIFNVLGALFWYFSGYIASEKFRIEHQVVTLPKLKY